MAYICGSANRARSATASERISARRLKPDSGRAGEGAGGAGESRAAGLLKRASRHECCGKTDQAEQASTSVAAEVEHEAAWRTTCLARAPSCPRPSPHAPCSPLTPYAPCSPSPREPLSMLVSGNPASFPPRTVNTLPHAPHPVPPARPSPPASPLNLQKPSSWEMEQGGADD